MVFFGIEGGKYWRYCFILFEVGSVIRIILVSELLSGSDRGFNKKRVFMIGRGEVVCVLVRF